MMTRGGFNLRGLDLRVLKVLGVRARRTVDLSAILGVDAARCEKSLVRVFEAGLIRCMCGGGWAATDIGLDELKRVWEAGRGPRRRSAA